MFATVSITRENKEKREISYNLFANLIMRNALETGDDLNMSVRWFEDYPENNELRVLLDVHSDSAREYLAFLAGALSSYCSIELH